MTLGIDFLDLNKSSGNKSENGQIGLLQTKELLHSKEAINRVKRQPMKWEKTSSNHVTNRGFVLVYFGLL